MDKFMSRKFILAVLSAVSGIAISLSKLDGKIGIICAIVSAVVPVVTYIITEGVIDAKAVKLTAGAIFNIADIFDESEDDDNGKNEE